MNKMIKVKAYEIDWGYENGYTSICSKVPKSATPISDAQNIMLFPYGCAELRVTEIPIVE